MVQKSKILILLILTITNSITLTKKLTAAMAGPASVCETRGATFGSAPSPATEDLRRRNIVLPRRMSVLGERVECFQTHFAWCDDAENVAGMGIPRDGFHAGFLRKLKDHFNIGLIITLLPDDEAPPFPNLEELGIQHVRIPIESGETPSTEQILRFIEATREALRDGRKVATHCTAGLDRTGIMLACWLIAQYDFEPGRAIRRIRELRPGAISAEEAIECIVAFYTYLHTE